MIHLKKIIKSILIIIGLRKRNPKIASDVKDELNSILGGQKINFIDVGGAVNLQPHHNKLIGNAIFYVFEPDVRSYNSLVETVSRYSHPEDFFYINKALSGKDGKRTLYLSNVPTGTSILKLDTESLLYSEKNDYFFPMKEMEIDTFSLSSILKERKLPYFDAIKLDVQGAELEIIKGIDSAMLEDVNLIELEIGFHNIYLEQTDFSDVCAYMKENGFELFDLRINRTSIPNTVDIYHIIKNI